MQFVFGALMWGDNYQQKKIPGPIVNKQTDVLSEDLVKSRSREIECQNPHIAMKFDRWLVTNIRTPVKYQNDINLLNLHLVASRLPDIRLTTLWTVTPGCNEIACRSLIRKHQLMAAETAIDCHTILAWWSWVCLWGMRHGVRLVDSALLWLAGLNIGWDCFSRNGLWAHVVDGNFRCFPKPLTAPYTA